MRVLLVLLLLAAPLAARADEEDEGWRERVDYVVAWNSDQPVALGALRAPMIVCAGTACADRMVVRLEPVEAEAIRELFATPAATAAEERDLIARAIALFETYVGAKNGTWADHPRNQHENADEDEPGQMDCVSEAGNTKTYLDRLDRDGLLVHHEIGQWTIRYLVVLQHVAVEITETETGESFVVDSWDGANGELPVIEPYLQWRMEWLV